VILYQEQVMRVAQALAGYTLEEADILRVAMGKKRRAVMEHERTRFIEGARRNGVSEAQARSVFEKIETFASYGFNRSHAAAYALTTYTTAYLKAHFPREFMAALMSLEMDDVEKTYKNFAALGEMGIRILPPDLNQSRVKFAVSGNAIRFGLGAVRGVGAKTAEAIILAREQGGKFNGMADFCLRLGGQWLNRRVLEALIKCGAFDSIGAARAQLMAEVEDALKLAQQVQSEAASNQMGLFGTGASTPVLPPRAPVAEWEPLEKLRYEKEALGFYVSAHPLDKYQQQLSRIGRLKTSDLGSARDGSSVRLAAVIHAVKLKNNRSGKRYATFSLEDRDGTVEAIAWPETYERYERIIHGDEPVAVSGKLDVDDERAQIIVDSVRPLGAALADSVREVRIRARVEQLTGRRAEQLRDLLRRNPGNSLIYLHLGLEDGREAVMLLGDSLRVSPTDSFVSEAERMLAPGSVELR